MRILVNNQRFFQENLRALSRRVDTEFGNLMQICRARDRLYALALGPPENPDVLRIVQTMSDTITLEMGRLMNLYDLMSEMALEIRQLINRSLL